MEENQKYFFCHMYLTYSPVRAKILSRFQFEGKTDVWIRSILIQNLQTSPIPQTSFLVWNFCRFLQWDGSRQNFNLKLPMKLRDWNYTNQQVGKLVPSMLHLTHASSQLGQSIFHFSWLVWSYIASSFFFRDTPWENEHLFVPSANLLEACHFIQNGHLRRQYSSTQRPCMDLDKVIKVA